MDKITFIKSSYNTKLSKLFAADGKVEPYPQVATVDSVEKEVPFTLEGLQEKHRLLTLFAKQGHAMMKGHFTKILEKERRAGLSDRAGKTRTLVFDFDGIEFAGLELPEKLNAEELETLAERVIDELPSVFNNTSYIAHASSSLGTKGNRISLHLEFWLEEEIAPAMLKDYLTWLNFQQEFFNEQIYLSASGTALCYKLDRCLADNSRMIFIAPPVFEDKKKNPFKKDSDRIILVEKRKLAVNLTTELIKVHPEKVRELIDERIQILHKAKGWKYTKPKTKDITLQSGRASVVTNPKRSYMSMYADHGDYCSFNIDGGDSHAYLVNKNEPLIVRNLKGEPYFLFEEADPDTFKWFTEEYLSGEKKPLIGDTSHHRIPYAYISREEDVIKYGYYDKENNELVDIKPTRLKTELESWFTQNGALKPEQLPYHNECFAPQDPRTIDLKDNFINTFRPSRFLFDLVSIPEEATGADMDSIKKMKLVAPNIYDLIQHVTGGGDEFPRFINWLAAIFQKRDKIKTCWVLHGVQGTGKGSLIDGVLRPIFQSAARSCNLDTLTEQYNKWLTESLIVMVDEFKASEAMNSSRLNNKLKGLITEPMTPIRAMRTDWVDMRNYANFIFCSNEYDAVFIEEGDRRYNVCPRQEIKIIQRYPDWKKRLEKQVPKELEKFTSFMMHFTVDMAAASTVIENEAKAEMQENAQRTQDTFVKALKTGDFEYFAEVLNLDMVLSNDGFIVGAKNHIKSWIRGHKQGEETIVFNAELRTFYEALVGKSGSHSKFGKQLSRLGVRTHRFTRDGKQSRGVKVKWKLSETDRQRLINTYNITKLSVEGLEEHDSSEQKQLPS